MSMRIGLLLGICLGICISNLVTLRLTTKQMSTKERLENSNEQTVACAKEVFSDKKEEIIVKDMVIVQCDDHQMTHRIDDWPAGLSYVGAAAITNFLYATEHKYQYINFHAKELELDGRSPAWCKVAAIQKLVSSRRYKYVMFLDSDAWFVPLQKQNSTTNQTDTALQFVERIFNENDKAVGMVSRSEKPKNPRQVNTGVLAFRGQSEESDRVLQAWWDVPIVNDTLRKYITTWPWEQFCLHEAIMEDEVRLYYVYIYYVVSLFPPLSFET
jgi:hypothetical protein